MKLFTHIKEAYDSITMQVLYNILIEFGIPNETGKLIKMCRNETCSTVRVEKHMSDMLPRKKVLKHVILYSHRFSTLL